SAPPPTPPARRETRSPRRTFGRALSTLGRLVSVDSENATPTTPLRFCCRIAQSPQIRAAYRGENEQSTPCVRLQLHFPFIFHISQTIAVKRFAPTTLLISFLVEPVARPLQPSINGGPW